MGLFAVAAPAPAQVVLNNSIKQIEAAPPTGPLDPHKAYVTRKILKDSETGEALEFEVALKMRNFAELQARVAHGEHISRAEMAARYFPLPSDEKSVIDWLASQGFTITFQTETHLSVFASGKVSQIAKTLQTTFARVTSEGVEYTAAVTAPQVPSRLAPLLVGINGLQPFLLLHTPPRAKPNDLTSANPPYVPSQIASVYMASGLYTSSPSITGAGQTIAILMDDEPKTTDLTTFWSNCGISQSLSNVTFIHVGSGNRLNSNDQTEATLDTEWSSSLAPGAAIRLYAFSSLSNTNINKALLQVYTDTKTYPIHQLTMSFGAGEAYQTASSVSTEDQSIATLAGAGVTLFASSGDGGSTPSSSGTETGATLNVEWPASNPNVAGVGGTSVVLNSDGSVNTEVVWNKNVVGSFTSDGGAGGGLSTFYSRPTWQIGTGVPSGTARCVPDVASAADPAAGAYLILNGNPTSIGGTSWSSPTWAAFCALINQSRANAGQPQMGLICPYIYQLAGTSCFRDITSGNNATSNSGGLYVAGVGYDLCTGIGVPNVQTLAQTLATYSSPTPQAPAITSGQPPAATINTAYGFTFTASGNPTPTFSFTPGALPPGLNLNSAGVLSGTPTADGPFTGTVTASNGVSPAATQSVTITVNQAPAITNGPPPATATAGTAYSFAFTATGYPAPTYSVSSGSLPPGLSLSSAGVLSGTPSVGDVFSGTITASNIVSPPANQNFMITVDQAPTIISGAPPATDSTGNTYNFTFMASGYPAPIYSLASGSLPPGISLSSAGVLSGAPTADGVFMGTISADNGTGNPATQNFTITISDSSNDSPTMPSWGLAILAVLLMLVAVKSFPRSPAASNKMD